ncbi:MAG TPA: substrate-binding domain-containing protein [Aggregatilineales bacterium]|jgi:ABC-type sugar transport system substrate-binding protein|nr:substrate-binding domain-containing protein [Aggregatilineales bacterium]
MNKKVFAIFAIVALALSLMTVGVAAQDEDRWVGADDLPVTPLACPVPEGAEAPAEEEGEDMGEMPAYDGGLAVDAPDLAGETITLIDVPKLIGIGYFNATSAGIQEAAAELGNVNATTDGPTSGDIVEQIEFIERYITQGVDGILFAANDPVAISPVLRDALSQGIHVVGYDANSEADARTWFVNQAEFNGIAKAMADSLVAEIGEDGKFAIVTSSFTAPNQGRWIAEMQAYMAQCYPNLTWLETVESQEDQNLAFQQTQTLINKYGAEMDGVLGMSSVAFPGAADAVQQAGLCSPDDAAEGVGAPDEESAIAVVGLSTPNQMKPFTENGCVESTVLWNPVDLGYAAVYVMRAVVDGELTPESTSVMAGRLGELAVVNGSEILLGAPFVYTEENIFDFDF